MVTPAQLPRLSRRGSDPDVRKARADLLDRGAVPVGVRGMVADSWLRSAAAGVNADSSLPPITLATDLLADYRAEHPLAEIFPLLYDVAGRAAEDCDSVLAVADERGQPFTEIARSTAEDIDLALDAAHGAKRSWGRTSATERANILNKIADRLEDNLEMLAVAETWDNGKPIRETLAADLPLAVDHFRYYAGAIRAQEGSLSQIDADTVAYHFHEPLGVVGQIIPWNFPILMAVWKLAPALAAGNCVVLKPAEQTPWSILKVMELIGDLLPAGVLNIVNGFGVEAGKPLASSSRIAKIAFTARPPPAA